MCTDKLSDLEMTNLCAEAMGLRKYEDVYAFEGEHWRPLHDDAQAMALVKKFALRLHLNPMLRTWKADWLDQDQVARYEGWGREDLNRAIVECVAKMRAAAT